MQNSCAQFSKPETFKFKGNCLPKLIYDNETFEILYANTDAEAIFNYSAEELLRLKLTDICMDDFSGLIDNEKIQLPISKLERLIQTKFGDLFSCETKDFDMEDFETSLIEFHNLKRLNTEVFIATLLENMA